MVTRFLLMALMKRAAYSTITGRYRDPARPKEGRFTRGEVKDMIRRTSEIANELIPEAGLAAYRSRGNRLNVALGVYSLATYRALRERGIDKEWAVELFADTGWRLYTLGVNIPLFFIRPFSRDPQTRLNFVLRAFLIFPFAEDPLGYKRTYGKETDHYRTDWYRCVVFEYFKAHASEEELEFFRRSWCLYDFALPRLIHPKGYYERLHTLSSGDEVCDMRWYGKKKV